MRMTNKIMQNNSLYNINNNKVLQDKLSTMMSTQKKITRPSDDPVIAIRALRLRTNVTELTQFYEKNAPDADSWLEVTEGALNTTTEVLTDLIKRANKAANKDLGADDLKIIVKEMKSLRDEFYATGNVDYAGRYVFTGYRTDTTLSFTEEVEKYQRGNPKYPSYKITEQNTIADFDTINYTNDSQLDGLNRNNYGDPKYDNIEEKKVTNGDIHRLRLSYDSLKGTEPTGNPPVYANGDLTISIPDPSDPVDDTKATKITAVTMPVASDPYQYTIDNPKAVVYVPETGEVLFGDAAYTDLEAKVKGVQGTDTEIRFTYTKDQWQKGDLRPEHYFVCDVTTLNKDNTTNTVKYNQSPVPQLDANGNPVKDANGNPVYRKDGGGQLLYASDIASKQSIEYDVGYNQKIQINTTAAEVFTHDLDRDMDDIDRALAELEAIEKVKTDLDNVLKGLAEGSAEYDEVKKQYDAAEKAHSYIRENVHDMMQQSITKVQGYLDQTNVAVTDNGTRSQRLALISNRLMDQKTTFQTLQSENEDIDIADVLIKLTSTELTYNSALMATGKIMQTSLMNYI